MHNVQILQNTHIKNKTKTNLRQLLFRQEVNHLEHSYTKAAQIIENMRKISIKYSKLPEQVSSDQKQEDKLIVDDIQKQILQLYELFSVRNVNFQRDISRKQLNKQIKQEEFLKAMNQYQNCLISIKTKLFRLEEAIQGTSQQEISQQYVEDDLDAMPPLESLNYFINVLEQKKNMTNAAVISGAKLLANGKLSNQSIIINKSQGQFKLTNKNQILEQQLIHPENSCESILLKEKAIYSYLKDKIAERGTQISKYENRQQTLAFSVKQSNAAAKSLNLQISVAGVNSFLLQKQQYIQHWRDMKRYTDQRVKLNPLFFAKKNRSISITVMEGSKLREDNLSSIFEARGPSSSINEQSLLQHFDYFISQKFIQDLNEHKL